MVTLSQYSELVSSIYAAALNRPQWPDVLKKIRSVMGGNGVSLLATQPDLRRVYFAFCGRDARQERQYQQYYGRIDPVAPIVERESAGTVLTCRELTSAEQRRGEFFRGWAHPYGVADAIFANLLRDEIGICSLVIAAEWQTEPFPNPERIELTKLLVPHLQRALNTQMKLGDLGAERDCALDVLDRLHHGIVLITHTAKVWFANRAALDISEQKDGLMIRKDRVCAALRREDAVLQLLLQEATTAKADQPRTGGSVRITRASGRRSFTVHVLPLETEAFSITSPIQSALAIVVDPERERCFSTVQLQRLFGFTRAEARVALRIFRGKNLEAIASDLSVTLSTVRIHTQRVFEKTHTHRQAELVRLLLETQADLAPTFRAGCTQKRGRHGVNRSGSEM